MSRLATVSKLASPFILAALTGCAGTMQDIRDNTAAITTRIQSAVAPTPEQIAQREREEAVARAQQAAQDQARAAAARDPRSYVAPSLNIDLANELHRQLQNNTRLNPQRQLMAFNSVPFERQLKAGASTASNPHLNPNNPQAAQNQVRSRVNGAVTGAMGNSTLGQIGSTIYNSAATAEAVNSKQLATTAGLLVQANNLANSGQHARAYAMVNGILNAAENVGLIGVPGTQPQKATANGITWQGVQDAIGIGSEGVIRNVLPSVGQGGALGDLLNKLPTPGRR